jgi:nucleotide-binding universal stress UspA family protein
MFHHLLVPLDGSRLAEAVVPVATSIAARAEARVTLLHVLERDAPQTIHGDRHLSDAAEAQRYLEHVSETVRARGVEVTWHVHERLVNDVPLSVVSHADELGPDLVMLAEHGAPHVRDWLAGTIAQRVVSRGETPVLLVRATGHAPAELPFERILVPLDGHAEHERGLSPAKDLARAANAALLLLTVVPTVARLHGSAGLAGNLLPGATRAKLDVAVATAQDYLAELGTSLQRDGLDATGYVARGDPLVQICEFCEARRIDTIALGTHGKAGTEAFWHGSLAQRLLRASNCSLLLTPVRD